MVARPFAGSIVLAATLCLLSSCSPDVKQHPTDLTVRVMVTPQNKQDVVKVLDRVTAAKGWVRTPAAPGLKELKGRDVLFFSYGRSPKDMLVTITDIKNISELEVSAFFEASAPGLVEGVVAQFVSDAKVIAGVSSVTEERRSK